MCVFYMEELVSKSLKLDFVEENNTLFIPTQFFALPLTTYKKRKTYKNTPKPFQLPDDLLL